jgi:hypothetical protein
MKKNDPALYRKLSEPFASLDAVNEELQAFQTALYELRVKHKIRDLSFQIGGTYSTEDGEELPYMINNHFGSPHEGITMLAYALGRATGELKDMERRAIDEGKKAANK